jgi:hypothetical protein
MLNDREKQALEYTAITSLKRRLALSIMVALLGDCLVQWLREVIVVVVTWPFKDRGQVLGGPAYTHSLAAVGAVACNLPGERFSSGTFASIRLIHLWILHCGR